jgi:hypothetical protein
MPHHESALIREFSMVTLFAQTSMLPVRFTPLMTVPFWVTFVTVLSPSPVGSGEFMFVSVCPAGAPVSVQFGHVLDPTANTAAELVHDPDVDPDDELGVEGDGLDEDGGLDAGAGLEGAARLGAGLEDAGLEDAGLEDAGSDDAGSDDAGSEDDGSENAGGPGDGIPVARDGHDTYCCPWRPRSALCPRLSKAAEFPSASSEMVCLAAWPDSAWPTCIGTRVTT